MRALVTGGAGFIGSHLVDALTARGDIVVALDDLSKGFRERVADAPLAVADVRDADAVRTVIEHERPEVVFHLAAQADVRVSVTDPAADAAVNVIGTINVLQAAHAVGARVLLASTAGVYGEGAPRPTDETVPSAPEAPYATAKLCAEEYVLLFNRLHGYQHAVLRLGNVYGPRQDPSGEAGVVSIFAGKVVRGEAPPVFGDGLQTRDYVYVADVVRGFLAAAGVRGGGRWNIGTGIETSVLDLVDGLGRASGTRVTPVHTAARKGELLASRLAIGAAARDLGWTPTVPLAEGLARVHAWVLAGEPPRGPA